MRSKNAVGSGWFLGLALVCGGLSLSLFSSGAYYGMLAADVYEWQWRNYRADPAAFDTSHGHAVNADPIIVARRTAEYRAVIIRTERKASFLIQSSLGLLSFGLAMGVLFIVSRRSAARKSEPSRPEDGVTPSSQV